jgi:hypothetical protein
LLRINHAAATRNALHAADNLACLNRWVEAGQGVSSRYDLISVEMVNPMSGQLPIAAVQDNLSNFKSRQVTVPDSKNIARPDCGEHAGACYSKPNLAGTASHIVDQFATGGAALCLGVHAQWKLGGPAVLVAARLS